MAELKELPSNVWQEVELDLQKHYETTAKLGAQKKLKRLGEGQGFSSDMCLLYPDWVKSSEDCEKNLPEVFVIKMSRKLEVPKKIKENDDEKDFGELWTYDNEEKKDRGAMKIHNTEALVLQTLKEKKVEGIAMPKVVGVRFRHEAKEVGYILMEYIPACDDNLHMCDNAPEQAVNQVLRSLANLQAAGFRFSDEEKSKLDSVIWNGPFKILFEKSVRDSFIEATRRRIGKQWPELSEEFIKIYETIDQEYLDFMDNTPELLGMKPVLCHGDVWMCNMLWNNKNPQNWTLEALLDYQACYFGCPGVDLARLYVGLISGEERRQRGEEYNRRFFQYLEEAVKRDGIAMPYTYEQLQESYRRVYPMCAIVKTVSIVGNGDMIVAKSRNPKAREILDEKLLAIMEDLVTEHRRNLEIIKCAKHSG